MRNVMAVSVVLTIAVVLSAQALAGPAFEVASVKRTAPGAIGSSIMLRPSGFTSEMIRSTTSWPGPSACGTIS
jgi:hypothetical protein